MPVARICSFCVRIRLSPVTEKGTATRNARFTDGILRGSKRVEHASALQRIRRKLPPKVAIVNRGHVPCYESRTDSLRNDFFAESVGIATATFSQGGVVAKTVVA